MVYVANALDDDAHAHVNKEYTTNDGNHFSYGYDLTNGIVADEEGDASEVHGQFHFVTKDGVEVQVTYTADADGYHPHGDIIPTPPPTPPAILRALEYIEKHPPTEVPHIKSE